MRQPAARNKPRTSELKSFPAPVAGWVANQNLAAPMTRVAGQAAPQGAAMLDNWFPTATGAIMRRGTALYATLGDGTLPVRSLFSYINGNQQQFFGATDIAIYDITTILTPFNYSIATEDGDAVETDDGDTFGENSTVGHEVFEDSIRGDWSVVQFATAGGTFLRGVNGSDTPFIYDGTTFGVTPAITGTGLDPKDLSHVWSFKNRLFFIEKESLDAWYLPVDSIGGTAVKFPMGGIFARGGSLLFGASWSLDENSGLSASCVFVTTEGEVAVYQGTDPSLATAWALTGVYRIGRPLGAKAYIRAGGDLVIATDVGFVPLSQAIQRDYAALTPSAVSYGIEVAWNQAVDERSALPWHCEVWPTRQMVVICLPRLGDADPEMFVANSRTGAWAKFTNWDGTCLELFKDRMFYGSDSGKVVEAYVTGLDQGLPYTATYVPLFNDLGTPASLKITQLARAAFRSSTSIIDRISVQTDYTIKLPSPPDAAPIAIGSDWGSGVWGVSTWGDRAAPTIIQKWRSVSGTGYALAPSIQVTSGSIVPTDAEIVRLDVTYQTADIVT
jgi:hypothetical protein